MSENDLPYDPSCLGCRGGSVHHLCGRTPTATFFTVADLKDPDDAEGRTYREINNAKTHAIPVGALVELESGVRLFVVHHNRDCDGTPLYALCANKGDIQVETPGFANRKWVHGYPESALTVVRRE